MPTIAETTDWTFLTNHGHVLLAVAADPDIRLRDIAQRVGVTERTAMGIVTDLERAGYVQRQKIGRRNHYALCPDQPLRHPLEQHHTIERLLSALGHSSSRQAGSAKRRTRDRHRDDSDRRRTGSAPTERTGT
ncbi:MAG: MarR family transcriptional regulator [Actinomycetota bacterium]|nr:MarR family transcriptional regulator [Actinomycetota bacterium]